MRTASVGILLRVESLVGLAGRLIQLLVVTAVLLTCTGRAADVTVNCANGDSIQDALDSLPAPPPGGQNNILIEGGPCNENISIAGQRRLWLGARLYWGDDPAVTINGVLAPDKPASEQPAVVSVSASQEVTLSRLILKGGRNGLAVGGGSVVTGEILRAEANLLQGIVVSGHSSLTIWDGAVTGNGNSGDGYFASGIGVEDNSSLMLLGKTPWYPAKYGREALEIAGNRGSGISVVESNLYIGGGVNIHGNLGLGWSPRQSPQGAGITASHATLGIGCWSGDENVIWDNPVGIALSHDSGMVMYGRFTVRNNATVGVDVTEGSGAQFEEVTSPPGAITIEGNPVGGVQVSGHSHASFSGPHTVRTNGSPSEARRAGIRVHGGSQVSLAGGAEVTRNIGPGISADLNSTIEITDASITNNAEEGIRLRYMSIVEIEGTTTIESNAAGPLTCDGSCMAISSVVLDGAKCDGRMDQRRVR
jgi:hypothetical protein